MHVSLNYNEVLDLGFTERLATLHEHDFGIPSVLQLLLCTRMVLVLLVSTMDLSRVQPLIFGGSILLT